MLYQAKTTRDGTIIGYRVSLPGWTDIDNQQVWLKASQVDRALSWNRVRPELDNTRPDPIRPAAPDRPRRDTRQRTRPTASQTARQGFAVPLKPPVVTCGDTEELAHALLVRLRQWRWYDRQHQQQRRGR